MADFISSFDPQELPPPFRFPNVSMTAFVLDLGLQFGMPALTSYCDTFLGVDPDVHYRPLAPVGYLCILDYPRMYCDAPGFEKWGYVPQKEVFFTFPAVRFGRALGNIFLPTELSWAMPFIAVNNPTSALTGRTVLGFQKLYGNVDIKEGPNSPFAATVSLPTFETLGRDVAQDYEKVIGVRTGPPNPMAESVEHHFPWSMMGHGRAMDYVENTSLHLLESIVPGLLEVINLKQMRGGQAPDQAVYQALVQSRMTFKNMTAPTFYSDPEFMIYPNASMDCGINGEELKKLGGTYRPALAAFSFNADLALDQVRDVYVAPPVAGTPTGGPIGELRAFWGSYCRDLRHLLCPFL